MALLHELVREKGNRGAAAALGTDPRDGSLVHEYGKSVETGSGGAVQRLLHQSHNRATLEPHQRK